VKRILLLLALVGIACSSKQKREQDFVPSPDTARRALDAYLAAWQAGEIAPNIPGTSPVVAVTDTLRSAGRPLRSYRILGTVPSDAPCCLAVRLMLDNPPQEVRERYVVIGIDPIHVIRHDDFETVTHWCNPSPAGKKEPARGSPES
jgi:hypothetical protein